MSKFVNHPIRGTKFYVYYGGADIDGSNKWVICTDPEDYDLLGAFMGDGHDQLWQSKEEAMEEVGRWLMSKAIKYINQSEYGIRKMLFSTKTRTEGIVSALKNSLEESLNILEDIDTSIEYVTIDEKE